MAWEGHSLPVSTEVKSGVPVKTFHNPLLSCYLHTYSNRFHTMLATLQSQQQTFSFSFHHWRPYFSSPAQCLTEMNMLFPCSMLDPHAHFLSSFGVPCLRLLSFYNTYNYMGTHCFFVGIIGHYITLPFLFSESKANMSQQILSISSWQTFSTLKEVPNTHHSAWDHY